MPTIENAELIISTERPGDRANVIVSCDVEFTEVEVNAMDLLGLKYTLTCQVINDYLIYDDQILTFHPRQYPRKDEMARHPEPVMFEIQVTMDSLHERIFGKDKLAAQLTLRNDETGSEQT